MTQLSMNTRQTETKSSGVWQYYWQYTVVFKFHRGRGYCSGYLRSILFESNNHDNHISLYRHVVGVRYIHFEYKPMTELILIMMKLWEGNVSVMPVCLFGGDAHTGP